MHRQPNLFGKESSPLGGLRRYGEESAPEALLIVCNDPILDSRLLAQFESEPVLVWRNTGPVVPPCGTGHEDVEAAIHLAVVRFGVREIAICGHLPSQPMRRLLEEDGAPDAVPADLPRYYAQTTRRLVQEKYGQLEGDALLGAVVEENVFLQLANLRTYPAVVAALARSYLMLNAWIYDCDQDELYRHGHGPSQLPDRIRRSSRRTTRPAPYLDPCDIYLA